MQLDLPTYLNTSKSDVICECSLRHSTLCYPGKSSLYSWCFLKEYQVALIFTVIKTLCFIFLSLSIEPWLRILIKVGKNDFTLKYRIKEQDGINKQGGRIFLFVKWKNVKSSKCFVYYMKKCKQRGQKLKKQ